MFTKLSGVRIRSLCAVVPEHTSKFEDEIKYFPFPEKSSIKLGKVMGFKEHRIADPETTLCDLSAYGLDYLFKKKIISKDKLEAIIFVSHGFDHLVPGNSKVIHNKLSLSKDTHCIDMYENCIGFISGLYSACSMLQNSDLNEVVLITANSGMCRANIKDRNTYPIGGDAAGIAVITKSSDPNDVIYFCFHHDGSQMGSLITPAGGQRMPTTDETRKVFQDKMGNFRSLNDMYMDGTAVFHYVMDNVPPLIEEMCSKSGISKERIEYHITHQPNRFMLEKLADLVGVPRERLFNNIVENFGNSSSATIPVNIAYNLGNRLLNEKFLVCMSAFGAGMSVAGAIATIGNFDECSLIEHPGKGCISFCN